MDIVQRQNQRRFHSTRDAFDRARVLNDAMRRGELNRDNVALCAFLNDTTCRLVLSECVRPATLLYFDRALNIREPRDIIYNLRRWGPRATITAACGVILNQMKKEFAPIPFWNKHVLTLSEKADKYQPLVRTRGMILNEVPDNDVLRKLASTMPILDGTTPISVRAFNSLRAEVARGFRYPGVHASLYANGVMEDDVLVKYMLDGVKWWALGEFA